MIQIVTLFLGLVTGPQAVELDVWELECDFGPTPSPHDLVAIARRLDARASPPSLPARSVTRESPWARIARLEDV